MYRTLVAIFLTLAVAAASANEYSYGEPAELTEALEEVLSNFSGQLLSPSDVDSVSQDELEEGRVFSFVSTAFGGFTQTYDGEKDGWHYFTAVMDDDTSTTHRLDGIVMETESWFEKGVYSAAKDECKYVIGECEYKIGDIVKTVTTEYQNGVWTKITKLSRNKKNISRAVYDKQGILLFSSSFVTSDDALFNYTYRVKNN